jgi:transcriptional regulator with XRE-family HTH domain
VIAEVPRWVFSPSALRARRKAAGFSQDRLARMLGTNQSCIAYWELGTNVPQLPYYFALVRALDCAITDLAVDLDSDNEAPSGTSLPDDLARKASRHD